MAARLAQEGFTLRIYNRTPEKADALRTLRVYVGASPADTTFESDAVISMLSDDVASCKLWLGKIVQSSPHTPAIS
jgi:3-hydroxyisobutyrate dehydrogenase-like beta-hydroxyacid dehydrogenase